MQRLTDSQREDISSAHLNEDRNKQTEKDKKVSSVLGFKSPDKKTKSKEKTPSQRIRRSSEDIPLSP